jgi:general secretion pathway protein M
MQPDTGSAAPAGSPGGAGSAASAGSLGGAGVAGTNGVGPAAAGWRGRWQSWWRGLGARERRAVVFAGMLLAAALLWLLALAPALRTLARVPAQIDAAEVQLQAMQRLAAEARELRSATPVAPEQAGAALRAATERLGEAARLALQGDRAVLTVNGVSGSALRDWLAEARSGARARPVEVSLTRGANGLSGTLVLAIGGAP